MSDRETVILPVKLNKQDRDELMKLAADEDLNISEEIRMFLAGYMKSKSRPFSGKLKGQGAPGQPRKPRKQAS